MRHWLSNMLNYFNNNIFYKLWLDLLRYWFLFQYILQCDSPVTYVSFKFKFIQVLVVVIFKHIYLLVINDFLFNYFILYIIQGVSRRVSNFYFYMIITYSYFFHLDVCIICSYYLWLVLNNIINCSNTFSYTKVQII